jgi:type IV pilus assembly protein PilY1
MRHPTDHGYVVVFGTGQFFDDADRLTDAQQTIYGIWDYGDDQDDSEYLGTLDHTTGELTHPADGLGNPISFVKQTVVDTETVDDDFYRILSNNPVQWRKTVDGIKQELPPDTDGGSQKPDPVIHAGGFFDFPNTDPYIGERVIKDITIRDGMAFVLSFIPKTSKCTGGGNSFFYILDPATGGRFETPVIDVNGDGKIDENDLVNIGTEDDPVMVSPTGKLNIGMLHAPKFIKINDNVDKVIMSDSSGDIPTEDIEGESLGMYYWRER